MRVLCCIGLGLVLSLGAAGAADPVTQFRHGPEHLGVFDVAPPANLMKQLWRFDTGNRVIASPIAADGQVLVGSMNGNLYAIDAKNGRETWHFTADGPISATAAAADGLVFFQSDANTVFALDREGREVWRHATGAPVEWHNSPSAPDFSDWDYYASSPLLAAGTLVIGSADGNVYALDPKTGAERWRFKTGSRVRATPASDGKTVFIGSYDGTMYAIDLRKGTQKWKYKTAGNEYFPVGEIQSSAALANGLVIFGSRDYYLYALDAKTGKEAWKNQHKDSWVVASPAVKDGAVYVGSSDAAFLRAVDVRTGAELWTKPVGSNMFSSPAIAGDQLFAGTFAGVFCQVDLKEKKGAGLLYDERIYSSPWVEDGVVFIGVNDGSVRALGAQN